MTEQRYRAVLQVQAGMLVVEVASTCLELPLLRPAVTASMSGEETHGELAEVGKVAFAGVADPAW